MKPQPVAVSMMIRKRRLARERRGEKYEQLRMMQEDVKHEAEFESNLRKAEWMRPFFHNAEWSKRSVHPCLVPVSNFNSLL